MFGKGEEVVRQSTTDVMADPLLGYSDSGLDPHDYAPKSASRPVEDVENNHCCKNNYGLLIFHFILYFGLYLTAAFVFTYWDFLWGSILSIPTIIFFFSWFCIHQPVVKIRPLINIYFYSFWINGILNFIFGLLGLIFLTIIFLQKESYEVLILWNARAADGTCRLYIDGKECIDSNCSFNELSGKCEQQTRNDFLQANHEYFISRPTIWAFGFGAAWLTSAYEEGLKYFWAQRYTLKNRPRVCRQSYQPSIYYFCIVSALAFGTCEAAMYTLIPGDDLDINFSILQLIYRLFLRIPFHIVCGTLQAAFLVRHVILDVFKENAENVDENEDGKLTVCQTNFLELNCFDCTSY